MPETWSPLLWRNDQSPALNESNLNRLEQGVEVIDDRVALLERGVLDPVVVPYATSVVLNATTGASFRCVATGDITLDDIVGGVDGQEIMFKVLASGAPRTLSFTGTSDSISIGSGEWWTGEFQYIADSDTWLLSEPGSGGGGGSASGTPADGSVTDAKVAANAAISLDKTADSTANTGRLAMTSTERAKLAGVASGATANSSDTTLLARANHTGTQAISTVLGLQLTLDAKAEAFPPVHAVGNSGAALTLNASATAGSIKTVTLTANCTLTLTGAVAGRATVLELVLTQDATGGRTVTWPSAVRWTNDETPTLSTTPGAVDRLVLVNYDGSTVWYGDLIGLGYA